MRRRPRIVLDWLRAHPTAADTVFAAVLASIGVGGLLTVEVADSNRDTDTLGIALALVSTASVRWRRTAPIPALGVAAAAIVPFWVLDYVDTGVSVPVLVLLYSVAAHAPDRRRATIAGAAAVGVLLTVMVIGLLSSEEDLPAIAVIGNAVVFATAWVLGDSLRNRRAYLVEVEARAERAERDREAAAARAVASERARIARELHDVVAHSVSVMVVQAGAARRVLDRHPEQAQESLSVIEATGRSALDELRRLLGVLRAAGDRAPDSASARLEPQPTAGDLDGLVDRMHATEHPIDVRIVGDLDDLPPGVGLTVYRVVQEALTNVVKHAGPAQVTVAIDRSPGAVDVTVVDDGRGAPWGALPSSGQGLVGMAERVEVFGGTLRTGSRPGGGFQVRASIPLDRAPTTSP